MRRQLEGLYFRAGNSMHSAAVARQSRGLTEHGHAVTIIAEVGALVWFTNHFKLKITNTNQNINFSWGRLLKLG